MKKIKYILASIAAFLAPALVAYAVVQSLNGQTGQTQTFTNDTNVTVTSTNNVHTLGWNGVLSPARGGTGASSFATGSVLFFSGGKVSENNSGLFWDGNLVIGGTTPTTIRGNGQRSFIGTGLEFYSSTGQEYLEIDENSPSNNPYISGGSGFGFFFSSSTSRIFVAGSINVNPDAAFEIIPEDTSGAYAFHIRGIGAGVNILSVNDEPSSTLRLGEDGITSCFVMADSDRSGVTYITANDGVLSATTTKPNICQ